ncbi:hypothetical protein D3C79_878850 [compost metagenome]
MRWPEVDRCRAVSAWLSRRRWEALAAGAWIILWRVEHRTGHGVVKRKRPEFCGWYVLRQCHLVGLGTIEVVFLSIDHSPQIRGANAGQSHGHRGRDAGDAIEKSSARVQLAVTGRREGFNAFFGNHRDGRFELVAGGEQHVLPVGIGVVIPAAIARIHEQAA